MIWVALWFLAGFLTCAILLFLVRNDIRYIDHDKFWALMMIFFLGPFGGFLFWVMVKVDNPNLRIKNPFSRDP